MKQEREGLTRREFLRLSASVGMRLVLPPSVLETTPEAIPEMNIYERFLQTVVEKRPRVGGRANYHHRLEVGLGFSTWSRRLNEVCLYWGRNLRRQMKERKLDYKDLVASQRNIFDITRAGERSIKSRLAQPSVEPLKALESGQYLGLMATRSPLDRGHKYLIYGVGSADPAARPEFLGVALTVDCPSRESWDGGLDRLTYNFLGWERLEWVVESSSEMQGFLPAGWSGNPKKLNEGRPGVLLVCEETFHYYSDLMSLGIQ